MNEYISCRARLRPEYCIHHFTSAGTDKSRESEDFTLMKFKRDILNLLILTRQITNLKNDFCILVGIGSILMLISILNFSSYHHGNEIVCRNIFYVSRADVSSVFQHRHPIAYFNNFTELVRNKDYSLALFLKLTNYLKQMIYFLTCQRRSRLIHYDYFTVGGKCLGYFNLLFFGNTYILNKSFGISF